MTSSFSLLFEGKSVKKMSQTKSLEKVKRSNRITQLGIQNEIYLHYWPLESIDFMWKHAVPIWDRRQPMTVLCMRLSKNRNNLHILQTLLRHFWFSFTWLSETENHHYLSSFVFMKINANKSHIYTKNWLWIIYHFIL